MNAEMIVDIPVDHRLTIDVSSEVPAGRARIVFYPVQKEQEDDDLYDDGGCPLCAVYNEPNEETIAAIEETRAMGRGEIPSIEFDTAEAFLADLKS